VKTAFERLVAARPAAVQEPVDEALLDRITAYEPRPVRRPRRLVWAAGLAAVLVTAGAVAVVRGATPAATPPAPQRLTVVAHVEKAMSERDYIVRSTYGFSANNGQKVVWTTWSDAVTGKLRASSTVSGVRMDTLFDGDLTTVVSYRDRAWWQLRSTPTPEPTGGIRLEGPPRTPTEIKKALASGIFHVDEGKQPVVNGHRTIQLSSTRPDPVLGSFTIWVDAASYLPVRISASDDAKIRFVGADLEWLPRDSASLANLNLAIPPGFRQADKPVEPKPPADGGVG
jgi:hypothetical protein